LGFRANPCLKGLRSGQSVAARDPSTVIGATSRAFSADCKIPCRSHASFMRMVPAMSVLTLGAVA
jgi:hypothetical protein